MRFIKTAIQIRSAIFANCSSWVRQNLQMPQLICHSKNSTASQNKQHEAHDLSYSFDIHVLNEACDLLAVRMQLCSLILFAVWYHLWFDIASEFDIICSLILSADLIWSAVWYHLQFDIMSSLILFTLIHSIFLSYLNFISL